MADRHHLGLCKNVLWPLFHYIPLTLEHGAEGIMHLWEGYVRTLSGNGLIGTRANWDASAC